MVRPGSPTLQPSVEVAGPAEVDEGSAVALGAHGRPPVTRAWLQLFREENLDLTGDHFNHQLVVDFNDRDQDDFDDFPELSTLPEFNDRVSSWRWFAPQGCSLQVAQHSVDDSEYPGRAASLVGDGQIREALNLETAGGDGGSMDEMISAVTFDCGSYCTVR